MFAGFFQDVFRMLWWVLWAWWNLMIISNESMDFIDPKKFDDPQLFDDPSYSMIPDIRWSPAIRWSQAIWWSPAIRWSIGSMDFDSPKVYGDTFISDGLVTCICQSCSIHIFFTVEEDISFLGWTRWKLLGIPWKSGRKRFVGSAPRLLIFHAAAYFEPRKNKTPLLAQKKHHHHFHQLRRSNHSCQKWYF